MGYFMGVLDSLKGKTVAVRARDLPTISGTLVDYDNVFIKVQTKSGTYVIPIYSVDYIQA